jgi:hypothetical protein
MDLGIHFRSRSGCPRHAKGPVLTPHGPRGREKGHRGHRVGLKDVFKAALKHPFSGTVEPFLALVLSFQSLHQAVEDLFYGYNDL